jgi:Immunoglobulin domain
LKPLKSFLKSVNELLQFVSIQTFTTKMYQFFQVLPIIVPFNFGEDELNLDDSVTVMCSITKGDLPATIWWRFSEGANDMSYNLTTNDGIVITRTSQKVSLLTIEAVKARHRGNYTCFAQNKAGVVEQHAYLAMNGSIV